MVGALAEDRFRGAPGISTPTETGCPCSQLTSICRLPLTLLTHKSREEHPALWLADRTPQVRCHSLFCFCRLRARRWGHGRWCRCYRRWGRRRGRYWSGSGRSRWRRNGARSRTGRRRQRLRHTDAAVGRVFLRTNRAGLEKVQQVRNGSGTAPTDEVQQQGRTALHDRPRIDSPLVDKNGFRGHIPIS